MKSVKIRTLSAPPPDLSAFDPGEYLSGLEFYETSDAIGNADQDGLAQFVHFLAFTALRAKSSAWEESVVQKDTLAFRALESHFDHLEGWDAMASEKDGLSYGRLVRLLMEPYPPHMPGKK